MKVVLNASSEKRNRRQVFPTPESPMSNNLNNKSYVFLAISNQRTAGSISNDKMADVSRWFPKNALLLLLLLLLLLSTLYSSQWQSVVQDNINCTTYSNICNDAINKTTHPEKKTGVLRAQIQLCRQRHLWGYRSRTRTRTLTLTVKLTLPIFNPNPNPFFERKQKRHQNIGQHRVIFTGYLLRGGVGLFTDILYIY